MFQFWLFADHGIYNSASHDLATTYIIRDYAPTIEGEALIYIAM